MSVLFLSWWAFLDIWFDVFALFLSSWNHLNICPDVFFLCPSWCICRWACLNIFKRCIGHGNCCSMSFYFLYGINDRWFKYKHLIDLHKCQMIIYNWCHHLPFWQPLNYLPNLEELSASGNKLGKLGDLSKCRKLQELDVSRNRLIDLTGIANLPNLQVSIQIYVFEFPFLIIYLFKMVIIEV